MGQPSSKRSSCSASKPVSRRHVLKHGAAGLVAAASVAASPRASRAAAPAYQAQPGVPADRLAAALSTLDTLTQESLTRTGVPGLAIAVVHNDQQVFAKGYGVRASAGSDPVDADTVFRLASMSKPLSSTVSAGLVGEGHLGWDARISDIMPEVEMSDPWVTRELTVRDLLCHRSGLPAYDGDLLVDVGYDRAQILHRLRYFQPNSSFRSQYAYNNLTYMLGNVAAARAAGLEWEDACAERLFKPLGMSRTSTRYADFLATPNHATEHVQVDGKWVHVYQYNIDPEGPAGSINTTVNDLSRWMRLQLGMGLFEGQQIVAAEALGETHRPQVVMVRPPDPNAPASFYCLGWEVDYTGGLVTLKHSGAAFAGASTTVTLWPALSLGITILSSAYPIGLVEGLGASFGDLVTIGSLSQDWLAFYEKFFADFLAALIGTAFDYTTPPADPTPGQPPAAYAGSYANPLYGPLAIVERDGGLVMQIGPGPKEVALRHYDGDVFAYPPIAAGPIPLAGMAFTIGPDRKAISVLLDEFKENGQGEFVRE